MAKKLYQAYLDKGIGYRPRTEHFNADGTPSFINQLILEDSPYLLQHAHNPVDWHPWSEAAFQKAKQLNKPIFLSIGYSTCHWCHVMERESFENLPIA
ncbi:MAG: thioredoxin domain-containing protein, partial [Candidatus Thiodiazotropha taylori]|nr:thioredoxin domain-containing protein [Candidatus Thiodiazotropha taylori]